MPETPVAATPIDRSRFIDLILKALIAALLLTLLIQQIPTRFGVYTSNGLSKIVLANNSVLVGVVERADAHYLRVQEVYQAHPVRIDGETRMELGLKRGLPDHVSEILINDRQVLLIEALDPESALGKQVLSLRAKLAAAQQRAQTQDDQAPASSTTPADNTAE